MVVGLRMGWEDLLFAHWPVNPSRVRPLVPAPLDLDLLDGDAWVSVVPLINRRLRPVGLPRFLGIDLPEVNVRTYVRHRDRAAIYFFSLDADGLASVLGARLFHSLPYYFARIAWDRHGRRVTVASRRRHPGARPARFRASYEGRGNAFAARSRERTRFLLERYRFYTLGMDGTLRYTDVEHAPWTLYPANAEIHTNTLLTAAGMETMDVDPLLHFSPGVGVLASPSRRVE